MRSGPEDAPAAHRAVAALVRRHGLETQAAARLVTLAGLLTGDAAAPTAVRDPGQVVADHLADALVALALPQAAGAGTIADLGSGAGVPGLPLAIARPRASVALVESSARKCEFLRRAVAACELANVSVVHARAEAWREGVERHELVTARALGPLAVVAEYAAPLLQLGGSLIVWRGRRDVAEEARAARAADQLGLVVGPVVAVRPYPAARHRHLHVMTKVARTPPRFPRRPGIARKRPLGGPLPASRRV